MKKHLIITLVLLATAVAVLSYSLKKEKAETFRLNGNQRSLLEDVRYYRTQDSLSAASVERLQFTNKEFTRYHADLKQTIERLNIKVKRLQSVAETGTETLYEVETVLKDSLVLRDSLVTLKCIQFSNPYLDLSGCIENNRFVGSIVSRDTLIQVVHRVPYRFWFIKWGCKAIRQEVVCRNPYSNVVYSKYIELK